MKGCLKCRLVNCGHIAKDCNRNVLKYGLPRNAMQGYEEWKSKKFGKKGKS